MLRRVSYIALGTYRELVRSKILYAVGFFALIIVGAATLFGTVTIGDQVKVIKDFGLFSISIFVTAFSVISGTSLLSKELSRKTIYNILGKPVARSEFLLGKYLGMLFTTLALLGIMVPTLVVYSSLFEGKIDLLLVEASLFTFLEVMIICAAAIFFSTIVVTPALSGLFAFSLFLAGRCTQYILVLTEKSDMPGYSKSVLMLLYWALPHLNTLNVGDSAVYGVAPDLSYVGWSFGYALAYSGVLLTLASIIFRKREFN